jgi:hypothetical protein
MADARRDSSGQAHRVTSQGSTIRSIGALTATAWTGIGGFAVLVAAQSLLRANPSPVHDYVSEYAAGPSGWIQTTAFTLLASGEFALGTAWWLRGQSWHIRLVAVMVGLGGLVDLMSAVFEIDADGAAATTHGRIHDLAGFVGFLAVLGAMILTAVLASRSADLRPLRRPSTVTAALCVLGFFAVGVAEDGGWVGLAQRYVLAVVVGWYAVLAHRLGTLAGATTTHASS